MPDSKHLWVIGLIAVTALIISSGIYPQYTDSEEEEEYWTMREALGNELRSENNREEVDSYRIKDTVEDIDTIKIPGYSIDEDKEGHKKVKFDLNDSVFLKTVKFKSLSISCVFSKDETFKKGQQTFTLQEKEYPLIYYFGENGTWPTIEPAFYHGLMFRYATFITMGDQNIHNITSNIDKDPSTGSFRVEIDFNRMYDFYPYPLKGEDLNFTRVNEMNSDFTNFSAKMYDKNDELITDLEKNSSLGDRTIKEGDHLVVQGNYCYETRYSIYIPIEAEIKGWMFPLYDVKLNLYRDDEI